MRQYLDFNDKIDEIKMLLNHFDFKDRLFIILEGDTDIRLFRSLFNEIVQSESVSGKQNVINIVKSLRSDGEELVAGICDADFDHILNRIPSEDFLFVTDYHDIEVMLLTSNALYSVISEYASNSPAEQLLRKSLLDNVLTAGKQIGLLRLINHIHDLQLNFKGLKYDFFCDISATEIKINIPDLISELIKRSYGIDSQTDSTKVLQYFNDYSKHSYCKYQLSCGHDLTKLISYVFQQNTISNCPNISQDHIERVLRIGYSIADFMGTTLGKKLEKFQESIGYSILQSI